MNTNTLLKRPFRYSFFNATFYIIGLNLLVYMATEVYPDLRYYLSMIPALVIQEHFYWQFFSYMFVHANFSHILFNMLGLFFFGLAVEKRMGSKEFLLFYLLTGTLAGIFSFLVYYLTGAYVIILLGASGAVFAVLLAYATYYPDSRVYVMGLLPLKASTLVILYTAIELFSQFRGTRSGVAHLTHLAGFGFAFLYLLFRLGDNPLESFRRHGPGGGGNYWR